MLKRAWYLLAAGWAALLLWALPSDQLAQASSQDQYFFWFLVWGPFAVPWVLGRAVTFIRFGSFRGRLPAPRR